MIFISIKAGFHTGPLGSGSFRPITKSAHVNFGPCQFRPINFVNLDFRKRGDILLKIFKIEKIELY